MTDSRLKVYVDFEVASEKGVDEYGACIHASHPSTHVLCLGYCVEGESRHIWTPDEGIPALFFREDLVFLAHNAGYDRRILNRFIRQTEISDWIDTSKRCRYYGYPAGLDEASKLLLGRGKDPRGEELIKQLCKPRRDGSWDKDPEKLRQLAEYCLVDIELLIGIDNALGDLPEIEQRCWEMYERMNDRGVLIDRQMAIAAVDLFREIDEYSSAELVRLTNGELYSFSQHVAIKKWVNARALKFPNDLTRQDTKPIPSTDVDHVKKALKGEYGPLDPLVERVLSLKGLYAKASVKKYPAALKAIGEDCRARDTMYDYGARTGRSTSKRLQLHNLETAKEKTYLWLIDALKNRFRGFGIGWIDWATPLGPAVRHLIQSGKGKSLVCADYSGIEARIFSWIADDHEDLERFRRGVDVYKIIAGQIYHKSPEQVTDLERAVGKEARLSGQYGVGWKTYRDRLDHWGIKITVNEAKYNINVYRTTNWKAKVLWTSLENAWRSACAGIPTEAGHCRFEVRNDWMIITSSAGRSLYFCQPRCEDEMSYIRLDRRRAKKDGGGFVKNHIYGGYIAENICQWLAGIKMRDDMLDIETQDLCDWLFMVHDEGIGDVPENEARERERLICDMMERSPSWAPDLPIKVESWIGKNYKKG